MKKFSGLSSEKENGNTSQHTAAAADELATKKRTGQDLKAEGLNASLVPIIAKKELLANVLADCL